MRWILLKEIIEIRMDRWAKTRAEVPEAPYGREILFLEMMAQTAGLLLGAQSDYRSDIVFGKVEKASFEGDLKPGTLIEIHASSEDLRPEGAWFQASVISAGNKHAEARFFLVQAGRLAPGTSKSVTFPEEFLRHFDVRAKVRSSREAPGIL